LNRENKLKKEILDLQLKTISRELDPHFAFNAINSLCQMALVGDTKGVHLGLQHFASLLRTCMRHSDQILIPLAEEIDFVVSYFEMQKLRFDNISLVVDIQSETDLNQPFPKMVIQNHVENAIKHGLRYKPAGGTVWLTVSQTSDDLFIEIRDDGVGRESARQKQTESTGKGLQTLNKIYYTVKQLYKMEYRQDIRDIKGDHEEILGTSVSIVLNH